MLSQKQMEIEFLEKMIEIARTDLNIDIKKDSSSATSEDLHSKKKK